MIVFGNLPHFSIYQKKMNKFVKITKKFSSWLDTPEKREGVVTTA